MAVREDRLFNALCVLGCIILVALSASLLAQDDVPCRSDGVAWISPEAVSTINLSDIGSCPYDISRLTYQNRFKAFAQPNRKCLVFWRIKMDSAHGDWHLFNQEDKRFLVETARGIASGRYPTTVIEWTALAGNLPK